VLDCRGPREPLEVLATAEVVTCAACNGTVFLAVGLDSLAGTGLDVESAPDEGCGCSRSCKEVEFPVFCLSSIGVFRLPLIGGHSPVLLAISASSSIPLSRRDTPFAVVYTLRNGPSSRRGTCFSRVSRGGFDETVSGGGVLKISSSSPDTRARLRGEEGMRLCFSEAEGICPGLISGCDRSGVGWRGRGLRGELIALVCGGVGPCEGWAGATTGSGTSPGASAITAREGRWCEGGSSVVVPTRVGVGDLI